MIPDSTADTQASSPLAAMFEEHHDRVYRAAYRVTGNPSDAEDVLQTVFLRLARQAAGAQPVNPRSYLYRAAVNCALDVLRRRRAVPMAPLEAASDARDATQGPDAAESAELRQAFRSALTRLSPRLAETFVLRYVEGYENAEIAELLKISRATVAVTLHRARWRLKSELKAHVGGM
jgi:RNA polymerase sigma-70 factor, ECF subfamily